VPLQLIQPEAIADFTTLFKLAHKGGVSLS